MLGHIVNGFAINFYDIAIFGMTYAWRSLVIVTCWSQIISDNRVFVLLCFYIAGTDSAGGSLEYKTPGEPEK